MPSPLVTNLDRYMFRQLLVALVAATTALVALIWLTQSLRFVELGGQSRPLATGVPRPDRAADPQFHRRDPAHHHLRRRPIRLPAPLRRPRDHRDVRRRHVALGALPPGRGPLHRCGAGVLRPQRLDRSGQLCRLPRIPVRDPQPRRRLPAAGGRVQRRLRRHDRLCPIPRRRRHPARDPGRGFAPEEQPRHHPRRVRPPGGGPQRPGRAAAERLPRGDRQAERPPQRADLRAELRRPDAKPARATTSATAT